MTLLPLQEALAKLFISGCNSKPVVVCLDNVHFLDAFSWKVILRYAHYLLLTKA